MFRLFCRTPAPSEVEHLASILVDEPACSPEEVFRRCQAADGLGALGPAAVAALPALLRTLVVPVTVDCALVLRVSAAEAIWKVSHRFDIAIPFLAWALRDEYWGVGPRAVSVLSEIANPAVVPDLIRLAEQRLAHGPFEFERSFQDAETETSNPYLASIAEALGRCALGRWEGRSGVSEARTALTRLAASGDHRVRAAAMQALAGLAEDP